MGVKYLFSACLLGINCRYDGGNSRREEIVELFEKEGGIPVCPEQLGGLPTPRKAAQFEVTDGAGVLDGKGRIKTVEGGMDVTDAFTRGAKEVLKIALMSGIKKAYLKDRSPSCGVNRVYIDGSLEKGRGVTAAILERNGIEIEGVE